MQVFRISCELYESIEPQILQIALNETIQIFHVYQSVLKRGFFWYYLESTSMLPIVHEENRLPCGPIYNRNRKGLLFDVSYYKNRVNLEMSHVLTDGTGAMNFLQTLLTKYLFHCHRLNEQRLLYDASAEQMNDDSFNRYYTGPSKVKRQNRKVACLLHGRKYPEDRLKIITGLVDTGKLLEAAHCYHTTLTVFLCASLMKAISETVPVRTTKKPIVLSVPVNLRSHFPSVSARNFFSLLTIEYNFWERSGTFEDIIEKIREDFNEGLSKANLKKGMDAHSALEHNFFARITPLFLKDLLMKTAYNYSERYHTAGFSNIGIVSMPNELESFIRSFDVYSGTNQLQACICSFQNRLSITFTSSFMSSEIQRRFFRALAELGAEIEIATNHAGDSEETP